MVLSKADQIKALDHAFITLFGEPRDSSFRKIVEESGDINPEYWVSLTDDEILEMSDQSGNKLNRPQRGLLRIYRDYIKFKAVINEPLTSLDFISIDFDDFTAYRLSQYVPFNEQQIRSSHPACVNAKPSVSSPSSTAPVRLTAVEQFQRGIKLDPTLYPVLKDE